MKPFKVFLILHSHIDIGYTERQEKMAVYQADFIRQAVDFALSSRQSVRDPRSKFNYRRRILGGGTIPETLWRGRPKKTDRGGEKRLF